MERRCLVEWCKDVSSMGKNLTELRKWGIKLWKLNSKLDLWNIG